MVDVLSQVLEQSTVLFLTFPFCLVKPYVDWFEYEDKGHPLSAAPEPKRRFIPSKWEAKKVLV